MIVNCSMCGMPKEKNRCEIVVLTADEKKVYSRQDLNLNPANEYYYCKPCWKVMHSDRAPTLMANKIEQKLRIAGVSKRAAKKTAESYRARLIETKRKANGSKTR